MSVIITYDLSGAQTQVKNGMIAKGYSKTFIANDRSFDPPKRTKINLPLTTLYHQTKNAEQAKNDLLAEARANNASVVRCISNELDNIGWDYIPGQEI